MPITNKEQDDRMNNNLTTTNSTDFATSRTSTATDKIRNFKPESKYNLLIFVVKARRCCVQNELAWVSSQRHSGGVPIVNKSGSQGKNRAQVFSLQEYWSGSTRHSIFTDVTYDIYFGHSSNRRPKQRCFGLICKQHHNRSCFYNENDEATGISQYHWR